MQTPLAKVGIQMLSVLVKQVSKVDVLKTISPAKWLISQHFWDWPGRCLRHVALGYAKHCDAQAVCSLRVGGQDADGKFATLAKVE